MDIQLNRLMWEEKYKWPDDGEEWSAAWGGSKAQWLTTIYPRISPFWPADSLLEIACGFGRWTKFLWPGVARTYRAVDLAANCVQTCRDRFSSLHPDFQAFHNDGLSLEAVAGRQYDFIFSFDSLVHADMKVLESYITQILGGLLSADGVCFLHHSNYGAAANGDQNPHLRDRGSSAAGVAELVEQCGGRILGQEIITWLGSRDCDAFTLFCRQGACWRPPADPYVVNRDFETEINHAKLIVSRYCQINKG